MLFEVWHLTKGKAYILAKFNFWQDCLDYRDDCLKRKAKIAVRTLLSKNYLTKTYNDEN